MLSERNLLRGQIDSTHVIYLSRTHAVCIPHMLSAGVDYLMHRARCQRNLDDYDHVSLVSRRVTPIVRIGADATLMIAMMSRWCPAA